MQVLNTGGGFEFHATWDTLPPRVARFAAVDVGYRNMGLCVYNVRDDRMEMLEWIDLARHPDADNPTAHEVAGRVVNVLRHMPNFHAIDLWVVEQQPVKANGATQPMNLIVQGAICGMCEMAGVPYLLFDPGALKKSLCPHLFTDGTYKNNKEEARTACALTMRPREMLAVVVNCARQHTFSRVFKKRYKGPAEQFEFDDIADAWLIAMIVCVRLQKRNVFLERMPESAAEYEQRIDDLFAMLRAPIPADMQYATECVSYEKHPFEVLLPHDGTAVPADIAYLRPRLFMPMSDEKIARLRSGEAIVEDARKRKLDDGDFRTKYRERKRGVSRTEMLAKKTDTEI